MAIATQADTRGGQITPEPPCLLEFRNIRIVYDNAIEAIRDVSIAVPERGIVALLGSNGAGKSTLLKAMSGILYTEEGVIENGVIRFKDQDVHRLPPDQLVRRGIVQVPEGRRVFPALTIDENLQMGGYLRTSAETRERRDQVFELFPRLFERRDQIAGYMSGGEQQMLAIGRALMTGPVLLALDEPSLQDFSSEMLRLKDAGVEVFLAGGIIGENVAMMKELEKLDVKPVVGIFWPGRIEIVLKLMGPASDGIYAVDYVEPFAGAAGQAFLAKAKPLLPEAEFKGINRYTMTGYAAAKVLFDAIGRCGKDINWACTIAEVEKTKNLETGVMTPVSFGPGVRFSNQELKIMQAEFSTLSYRPVN